MKIQNCNGADKPQQLKQLLLPQLESCEKVHEEIDQIYARPQRWQEQWPKPILDAKDIDSNKGSIQTTEQNKFILYYINSYMLTSMMLQT